MLVRTISALLALPILFIVLLNGGPFLYGAAIILSFIGQYEFYRAFDKTHNPVIKFGYIMTLFWYMGLYLDLPKSYETFCIMVYLFGLMGHIVFSKNTTVLFDEMISFMGFFYVAFTISHILMISDGGDAFFLWYPFIIAFSTDTFAYLTGKLIGKRPLIPSVSPKKTVEGSLGGLFFCIALSVLYAYILKPEFIGYAVLLGVIGSPMSQVGDLVASKIKRMNKIKDFGKIMPGHGGVLDRFDSLIMTIPLVYYVMVFFLWVNR